MRSCPRCKFKNDDLRKQCASCGLSLGRPSSSSAPVPGMGRTGSDPSRLAQLTPGERQKMVTLLRESRKIEAIKLHRDRTGLGLKESKEAVELLARQSGIEMASGGGVGVLLGILVLLAVLGFMFLA